MTTQRALTIVAEVRPDRKDELVQLLQRLGENPGTNECIAFGRLPGTHYARIFFVDEGEGASGETFGPILVLMSDIDGSLNRYLRRLVREAGEGLDRLYAHCAGYPGTNGGATEANRLAYLRARLVPANTTYVNTIGRTVEQIQQEATLRDAIERFLSANQLRWDGADPASVRSAIQDFVRGEPGLSWARRPAARLGPWYRLRDAVDLVALPLLAIILLPALIAVLPVWLVLLRYHEIRDPAPHVKADAAHIQELDALEDHGPQNQFTAVGVIKPGWFRRLTVMVIFRIAGYGTRHVFNRGSLGGVKTIHFARWVSINGQKRAIFVSNYDGSLESYMDDFIDQLYWGLNAVFSNGVGYPKTRFLLFGGAQSELQFKDYLRFHQIPTQVWYSAYGRLTALNIENNARIRAGLSGQLSDTETREWLHRF